MWRKLCYKEGAHRSYTLDEVLDDNYERFLLDGVIPTAELTVCYGSPKAGKSAWAHKLSVAVASDNADLDGMPVEHGRVLFGSFDPRARRGQVKRRIAAVAERMGVPEVMDNKKIVLLLHHATKSKGDMYGSTFLDAALDARLFVERVKDRVTVTVEVIKNGEPPGRPFVYQLEGEFLAPVADDSAKRRPDEPPAVIRADMLALMPVEWMAVGDARKIIERLLRSSTPAGRAKEWERIRERWEAAGLIVQKSRRVRRIPQ